MARYCIAFETMKKFCKVTGTESTSDLVSMNQENFTVDDKQMTFHG